VDCNCHSSIALIIISSFGKTIRGYLWVIDSIVIAILALSSAVTIAVKTPSIRILFVLTSSVVHDILSISTLVCEVHQLSNRFWLFATQFFPLFFHAHTTIEGTDCSLS
jgi:hypothetical protein